MSGKMFDGPTLGHFITQKIYLTLNYIVRIFVQPRITEFCLLGPRPNLTILNPLSVRLFVCPPVCLSGKITCEVVIGCLL